MSAGHSALGSVKIRRRGRHASPSQVGKVAQQAGKAAPAVAIAGALVAVPQASQHLTAAVRSVTATAGGHAASTTSTATHATVAGSASHATVAYSASHAALVSDSAAIATAHAAKLELQSVAVTVKRSRHAAAAVAARLSAASNYAPRHSSATATASTTTTSTAATTTTSTAPTSQGTYSCSGLEQLWEQAGGSSGSAFMAAEIAMAESGGNPNAISPTSDYGLWQINSSNGALATLNPLQNAKSAVALSADGTNWSPWTTYTSGAYAGKC